MAMSDVELATVAQRCADVLRARGLRVAVAESCTGGWIAKVLTDLPGSSRWFDRGFVTYSNDAKCAMLGVAPELIVTDGAVSETVARAMAGGARRASAADVAIAVTGIAGPGGGTAAKPVGTVCFGWSSADCDASERLEFAGDRDTVRRASVAHALGRLQDLARTIGR